MSLPESFFEDPEDDDAGDDEVADDEAALAAESCVLNGAFPGWRGAALFALLSAVEIVREFAAAVVPGTLLEPPCVEADDVTPGPAWYAEFAVTVELASVADTDVVVADLDVPGKDEEREVF